MRIVIDTNVVISGLVSAGGPPARIVGLWIDGVVQVAVTSFIVSEYLEVVLRPKFAGLGPADLRRKTIERLIDLPNTTVVVPDIRMVCVPEDPSDDRFLECAKVGQAAFLVSGDDHLLGLGDLDGIKIVTSRQFVEMVDAGGIG